MPSLLQWLAALKRDGVAVWNPAALVRWNSHKGYLREQERSGVPIVPTAFVERGSRVGLAAPLRERGWAEAVVKPAVSASAYQTSLVSVEGAASAQASLDALLAAGDVLVQRFMPEVRTHGEWSLMFIDGAFSHGALKRPADGDFRVQSELGGTASFEPPPPPILEQARRLLDRLPHVILSAGSLRCGAKDLAGSSCFGALRQCGGRPTKRGA